MKGHLPRFVGGEMVHSPIFDLVNQAVLDRILCQTSPAQDGEMPLDWWSRSLTPQAY